VETSSIFVSSTEDDLALEVVSSSSSSSSISVCEVVATTVVGTFIAESVRVSKEEDGFCAAVDGEDANGTVVPSPFSGRFRFRVGVFFFLSDSTTGDESRSVG